MDEIILNLLIDAARIGHNQAVLGAATARATALLGIDLIANEALAAEFDRNALICRRALMAAGAWR